MALLAKEVEQVCSKYVGVHPGRQVLIYQVHMVHQQMIHEGLTARRLLHTAAAGAHKTFDEVYPQRQDNDPLEHWT